MLTDLCQELRNWFDRNLPKYFGTFSIHDGDVFFVGSDGTETSMSELDLATNQYFRIVGSVFNDGVHKYASTELASLVTERFNNGAVWLMAVPPAVIALDAKIKAWQDKYGEVSASPFTSESFGGYSYSKSAGTSGANGGGGTTWQSAFKSELNKWRKI